jgi:serine/threonine protein kinase
MDEYQLAIQNPRHAFKDPQLQACAVETTPLGLPAVKSGGFALIYHLYRKEHWAVRCFYHEIGDLQYRYDAISRFLEKNANGTFVKASLQPEGILVGGQRYPVLVMPWVVGDVLNLHIERNLSKPNEITWLADVFLKLVNHLEQLGVAHGDLQHGNIMVRNNALTLIDYDGMYLPELSKSPAKVLGHLNYIHPDRPNVSPSVKIDCFPSIVIYLGLRAVAAQPSLWRKYSDGENILFKRNDFLDPLSSPFIDDLKQIPSLRTLAEKFQAVCFLGFDKIPSLSEFISVGYTLPPPPKPLAKPRRPTPTARPVEYITQYEVVLADNTADIQSKIGEKLEIVGQITASHRGVSRRNQPYMFLNFGDWRRNSFYLVLWEDALDLFRTSGIQPSAFVNKWVSVTGMITEYNGRTQIVIEMPSQIQKLANQQEAVRRANAQRRAAAVTPSAVAVPSRAKYPSYQRSAQPLPTDTISRQQADALQKLYARTPSIPISTPSHLPSIAPTPKRMFASPRLSWVGISLTVVAIGLLIAASPFWLPMLILGLALTYLGALYRSDLVPISIQSSPIRPQYTHRGVCRGCGNKFGRGYYSSNPGLLIVQTERGYMHHNCARQATKRVWRRQKQIGFPTLRPIAHRIAIPRSRRRNVNLLSLGILCVSFLSVLGMSYPSIPFVATAAYTSASFLTQTSFATTTYHSYVFSSISSTRCKGEEFCTTISSIRTSTLSGIYTSIQNLGAYVQSITTSITNLSSLSRAPYVVLGISSFNWMVIIGIIILITMVAAVLIRRL